MIKQANPKLIGIFVLGAIILSIAALFFFGRGGLFSQRESYLLYFDRSVKGLSVGAPVMFRGVRIGQVTDISVHVNPDNYTFRIPVTISIEPERIEEADNNGISAIERLVRPDALRMLIAKGLRAQLQLQSLVTGQLFVQLDMYPGTTVVLSNGATPLPEIPTIPSELEQLTRSIENIPIDEVIGKLMSTLDGIEELVHSPDLANTLFKMNQGMSEIRAAVKHFDAGVATSLQNLDATLAALQSLSSELQTTTGPLATDMRQTLTATTASMEQTGRALAAFEQTLQANTRLGHDFQTTLEEIRKAARGFRLLSDEIERHPEILLRGKNPGDDQ